MVELNAEIAKILAGHSPEVVAAVEALRELVREVAPDLKEEPKLGWKNLIYKKTGVVVAISPHKDHANLHFYRGTSLNDPEGRLEGPGKELRHVKIRRPADLSEDYLKELVRQAVELDPG